MLLQLLLGLVLLVPNQIIGPKFSAPEELKYGTIHQGADGKRYVVFTNEGTEALLITAANPSCGCTVPEFPKYPIAPGAKDSILVNYTKTDVVGPFNKSVTITTNEVESYDVAGNPSYKMYTIRISGTVVAATSLTPDPGTVPQD